MFDIFSKSKFLLIVCLCLAGCRASISYVEKPSSSVSRVRFATTTSTVAVVNSYDEKSCIPEKEWMRLRDGFFFSSDPKTLGMPLWTYSKNAAKEFYVPAGKEAYFFIVGSKEIGITTYYCEVVASVMLEEGKDYELLFSAEIYSCTVTVTEIIKSEDSGYRKILLDTFTGFSENYRKALGDCSKLDLLERF